MRLYLAGVQLKSKIIQYKAQVRLKKRNKKLETNRIACFLNWYPLFSAVSVE